MRISAAIIAFALSIAVLFEISGVASRVDVAWEFFDARLGSDTRPISQANLKPGVSTPVTLRFLDGQSLVATIEPHGLIATLRLVIAYRGSQLRLVMPDGNSIVLRQDGHDCSSLEGGGVSCRLLLNVDDPKSAQVVIAPTEGDVVVESVDLGAVRIKQATILSGNTIYIVFLCLVLLGPVLVWLRRFPGVELVAIVTLSMSWMVFLSAHVLVAIFLFLAASLLVLRWLGRGGGQKRVVLSALVVLVLIVGIVKIGLPYLGYVFANPGGLWFVLPLGFSYFIIKLVDLLLQVRSGCVKDLGVLEFFGFMLFPATLAAGPIYTLEQFRKGPIGGYSVVDWSAGTARLIVGVVKKVCGDSFIYPLAAAEAGNFMLSPESASVFAVMSFLVLTTVYVYVDFSAYSDMAIGAGRAMGWDVPENFNLPLLRQRMRFFWQNWHMTLSNWVFRRVFVATLMSSRKQGVATFASMLTIGLWHRIGMSWSLWALHHSLMLVYETRVFGWLDRAASGFRHEYAIKVGEGVKVVAGLVLVWGWVSLGHAFTQFSDWRLFVIAYSKGLIALVMGAGVIVASLGVVWMWDKMMRSERTVGEDGARETASSSAESESKLK